MTEPPDPPLPDPPADPVPPDPAPADQDSTGPGAAPRSLRRELFWLVPAGITTVGATMFMFLNRRWGADASAILAFPVGLVGIVVAILIQRGAFQAPALRVPRGRRRTWRWMAALLAIILAGTSAMWWFRREGSPFDYLAGTVRIGYTSMYQGWHTDSTGTPVGFDADVAREIQRHFHIRQIIWVPLGSLDNRMAALRGRWRDEAGTEQAPVKLVISNFSMTPAKAERIDFAGPYFVDTQGLLSRRGVITVADLPQVCVLRGSTSADTLKGYGWRPVERASVAACVSEYKNGFVEGVSADRSTLAGFAKSIDPKQSPPIGLNLGAEKYGIGMPNNMPRLCAELSAVLNDFLTYQWADAFRANLQPIGLSDKEFTRPPATDPCQQPAPWYGG